MQTTLPKPSKELLIEALAEMMRSRREEFVELLTEALEDIALGTAIVEGRKDDFVSEEEIRLLLFSDATP
ncbi:MAG: hypothetical protein MUF71_14870 [Candidatus Kapabacteria bacterium]|jgi:hypothetical protein|nr:hypothetical protein [Candidatus Kapabacteria bacterium]